MKLGELKRRMAIRNHDQVSLYSEDDDVVIRLPDPSGELDSYIYLSAFVIGKDKENRIILAPKVTKSWFKK